MLFLINFVTYDVLLGLGGERELVVDGVVYSIGILSVVAETAVGAFEKVRKEVHYF
mgnify:CR=1 FL=1